MANYELTILIDGKATPAKVGSIKEKISKLIDTFKGKIKKTEDWDRHDLAYKIGKSETGVYLFFELELESQIVKQLNSKLSLEKDLLRYLLIRK